MYTTKIEFNQLPKKTTMSINAYHIHIYVEGQLVFKRDNSSEGWLDPIHTELTQALDKVESIVKKITQ